MKLKRPLLFALIFLNSAFFLTALLNAETVNDDGVDRITSISVTGLKRTKLSTAERPLRRFIGRETERLEEDEVRAAVLDTGVLEPISVEIRGQTLSVTVREKWAIFPVPVFMIGSGGIMAGLAFFDANAFGLADNFFLAGLYRTGGWSASAGYIHNSREGHLPGWNLMTTYSREERHDRNQSNDDLRRFRLDSISVDAGIGFPLIKDSDLLSASALFSYDGSFLRDSGNMINAPDEDLQLIGAGTELSLRRSSWDGFFLSEESASVRYFYRIAFNGFSYHSARFRGVWEKSLVPGFRVNIKTGALFEPSAPVLFESSPLVSQVAILPRDFSARSYAGISAGLEKHIYKFSAGTFSLSAAYQLVWSRGPILGDSLDHGILGMFTFYLSRIAIPALGLGIAYNVREHYLQATFALGMYF